MPSEIKFLEVRDAGTTMPVMAIRLGVANDAERFLLKRAGFVSAAICDELQPDPPYVIFCRLDPVEAQYDPFSWRTLARTIPTAHTWAIDHWHELASGDVVDVQFIRGETTAPKESEARHAI